MLFVSAYPFFLKARSCRFCDKTHTAGIPGPRTCERLDCLGKRLIWKNAQNANSPKEPQKDEPAMLFYAAAFPMECGGRMSCCCLFQFFFVVFFLPSSTPRHDNALTMLLSARTFRRRSRLAVLFLIGVVVYLVHRNRTSLESVHVHLPEHIKAGSVWRGHHGRGRKLDRLLADVSNSTLGVRLLRLYYTIRLLTV